MEVNSYYQLIKPTVKNIWKSYIWTADKEVSESDPCSNVHYLGSSENKAWKNSGLYGIWTHDLCDTGAELTSQLGADHDVGSK